MTETLGMAVLSEKEGKEAENSKENEVTTANKYKKSQSRFYDICAEELIKFNTKEQAIDLFKRINQGLSVNEYTCRPGLSYEKVEKILQNTRSIMVKNNNINKVILNLSCAEIFRCVQSANFVTQEKHDKVLQELKMSDDWQSIAFIELLWQGYNPSYIEDLDDLTLDNIDTDNNIVDFKNGIVLDVSDELINYLVKAANQRYVWLPGRDTIRKCPLFGKEYNSVFRFNKRYEANVVDPKRKYNNRLNNVMDIAPTYVFTSGLFHRINLKLRTHLNIDVYDVLENSTENLGDKQIYSIYNDEYKRSRVKINKRVTYAYIFK